MWHRTGDSSHSPSPFALSTTLTSSLLGRSRASLPKSRASSNENGQCIPLPRCSMLGKWLQWFRQFMILSGESLFYRSCLSKSLSDSEPCSQILEQDVPVIDEYLLRFEKSLNVALSVKHSKSCAQSGIPNLHSKPTTLQILQADTASCQRTEGVSKRNP